MCLSMLTKKNKITLDREFTLTGIINTIVRTVYKTGRQKLEQVQAEAAKLPEELQEQLIKESRTFITG